MDRAKIVGSATRLPGLAEGGMDRVTRWATVRVPVASAVALGTAGAIIGGIAALAGAGLLALGIGAGSGVVVGAAAGIAAVTVARSYIQRPMDLGHLAVQAIEGFASGLRGEEINSHAGKTAGLPSRVAGSAVRRLAVRAGVVAGHLLGAAARQPLAQPERGEGPTVGG